MKDIKGRASAARSIKDLGVLEEVRESQVRVFLSPSSSEDDIFQAHQMICALTMIDERLDAILLEEALFDKREGQHRAND